jgi:hypothetical protein
MDGYYTSDGSPGGPICRNCQQTKGLHAAITSGINDEHWCPNPKGGFREDSNNIGPNTFRPQL